MVCPGCKASNLAGMKFCARCGMALPPEPQIAPPEPKLVWEGTDGAVCEQVLVQQTIGIGRAATNEVVLANESVSRHHARITRTGNRRYIIVDLGSAKGTLVNGEPVLEARELYNGDIITIGQTQLRLVLPFGSTPPRPVQPAYEKATAVHGDSPRSLAGARETPRVTGHTLGPSGPDKSKEDATLAMTPSEEGPAGSLRPAGRLVLPDGSSVAIFGTVTIGRGDDNDIALREDRQVSRHHARLEVVDGVAILSDVGSRNGTMVNGQPIAGPLALNDGDVVKMGATEVRFFREEPEAGPGVDSGRLRDVAEGPAPEVDATRPLESMDGMVPALENGSGLSFDGTEVISVSPGRPRTVADSSGRTSDASHTEIIAHPLEAPEAMVDGDEGTVIVHDHIPVAGSSSPARRQPDPSSPTSRLVLSWGPGAGQVFYLTDDEMVIGRAGDVVSYDIPLQDRAVSRPHARIRRQGRLFILEDLESANGTWVNYERVVAPRELRDGDVIKVGQSFLLFREPAPPSPVAGPGGHEEGKIITVFGLKGGVGRTSLAVNLALLLGRVAETRVALVDMSLEQGSVAAHLDLLTSGERVTLADLSNHLAQLDTDAVQAVMTNYSGRLAVLPAPPDPQTAELVTPEAVGALLPVLRQLYRWVVVDTAPTFSDVNLSLLDHSDVVLLVSAPDVPTLRATRCALDVFKMLQLPPERQIVVLNRPIPRQGVALEEVEKFLGEKVHGVIPHGGEEFARSADCGIPLAVSDPDHPSIVVLEEMARKLAGVPAEETSTVAPSGWGARVRKLLPSLRSARR